jgi:hypothetical protein
VRSAAVVVPGSDRTEQDDAGLLCSVVGVAAADRHAGREVMPQARRIVDKVASAAGDQQAAAVFADQAELLGGGAQLEDGEGEVLSVGGADPLVGHPELVERRTDQRRWEVAGRGQSHAVVTELGKQPSVRPGHACRGVQIDTDGPVRCGRERAELQARSPRTRADVQVLQ